MEKNVAGKWIVFAYGNPSHASAGLPITGDAANITANIRIDGGAANAVDDLNPTELEDGYYVFDITAAEANGDLLSLHPQSSTSNVIVIGVPGAVWTRPANFNALGIAADGDISGDIDGSVASVVGNVNADLIASQSNKITFPNGIIINRTDSNSPALDLNGNGNGAGLDATGGSSSGDGIKATGGSGGSGMELTASGSGDALRASASGTGAAFSLISNTAAAFEILPSGAFGVDINGDMNISGGIIADITGNLSGSIGSNLELGPSEVNAEVVDVLTVDTFAEPGQGTPPATASLADKIAYLFKAWRNRSTQTATQYSLYNDDATTVDQKATVSDNGTTADKGEVATGP